MASINTPALSCEVHTKWVSGLADNSVGVTVTCSNGESLYISEADLSQDILRQALAHGLKQKLMDAGAISRDPVTGRSASAADKFNAIKEVADRLMVGQWNKVREGGSPTGGLLLSALMVVYPTKTREQLVTYLAGKSAEEKTALRKVAKIADAIELIKLARAKDDGIDGDSLLDELDD